MQSSFLIVRTIRNEEAVLRKPRVDAVAAPAGAPKFKNNMLLLYKPRVGCVGAPAGASKSQKKHVPRK